MKRKDKNNYEGLCKRADVLVTYLQKNSICQMLLKQNLKNVCISSLYTAQSKYFFKHLLMKISNLLKSCADLVHIFVTYTSSILLFLSKHSHKSLWPNREKFLIPQKLSALTNIVHTYELIKPTSANYLSKPEAEFEQ